MPSSRQAARAAPGPALVLLLAVGCPYPTAITCEPGEGTCGASAYCHEDLKVCVLLPDGGLPPGAEVPVDAASAPADGAQPDSLRSDAALPDVTPADAAPPDGVSIDGTPTDAASPDVTQTDVRPPDAALPDSALPDSAALCAPGWWDCAWQYRQRIRVDNLTGVAHSDVPLPVFLTAEHVQVADILPGGRDVRFVSPGGVTLLHDVDGFSSGGVVWVSFPSIAAASDQSYVWLYYGNSTPPAAGSEDIWGDDYVGVWHLTGDALDSSGNANHPSVQGGDPVVGLVNGGRDFDPVSADALVIQRSASVDTLNSFTLTAWLYRNSSQTGNRSIFARQRGTSSADELWLGLHDNALSANIHTSEGDHNTGTSAEAPSAEWFFCALTYDGNDLRLYQDGGQISSAPASGDLYAVDNPLTIAGNYNGTGTILTDSLDAVIDEVQLLNAARSAAWIRLQHDAQRDQLLIYDAPESR